MAEIEYEVREQDLIAFNEHQISESQATQKFMRRHQAVVPGVIVSISLLLFFYYKDIPTALFAGVVGVLWGSGVPAYFKWSWRKQVRAMYTEEEKTCILGHYTLRTEPKELVEISERGESRIAWDDILRVEVTKRHVFIFVSSTAALIIPRKAVKKGELHTFVKEADQLIAAAE
ncbi:YcxB family protein [Methylococcus sp. EFPC2]|uniref:YcxB family protein n=1 Tax=Methylococcus sp. EFPC2 TaxID=2812648 RepID=UPI001967CA45|nr:YcxB family protein [Methylococcus sp. EFPC2]QSA98595.1 YcxB family protein [Methylococcus sp. EFPC2]